jgi:hypothetical protein
MKENSGRPWMGEDILAWWRGVDSSGGGCRMVYDGG